MSTYLASFVLIGLICFGGEHNMTDSDSLACDSDTCNEEVICKHEWWKHVDPQQAGDGFGHHNQIGEYIGKNTCQHSTCGGPGHVHCGYCLADFSKKSNVKKHLEKKQCRHINRKLNSLKRGTRMRINNPRMV